MACVIYLEPDVHRTDVAIGEDGATSARAQDAQAWLLPAGLPVRRIAAD